MASGVRQNARLFLEGREVPFSAAQVVSNEGQPITVSIDVVPLQVIKFVRPRTHVMIFMRDTLNFASTNNGMGFDPNQYYLVFEGEVVGRGMVKAQDQRSFTLLAADYSSYWDQAQSYFMNPNFVNGKMGDVVSNGDVNPLVYSKALGGKTFTVSTNANLRIIDIILGASQKDIVSGVTAAINQLATANEFLRAAFERLRIEDRLTVYSSGKLKAFLQDLKMDDFMASYAGMNGGQASVRQLLNNILGLVFHTFISIPFPPKIPATKKSGFTIANFLYVPDAYTLPAPMCNVIFPSQYGSYSMMENFMDVPTRYLFRAGLPEMVGQTINYTSYPLQAYPQSFSDYMFGKRTATKAQLNSLLGPSTLVTAKNGNSYANIFLGNKSQTSAVGTAFGVTLRECDYLSNEESVKGIVLAMDTFMPNYASIVKRSSPAARAAFTQAIGSYIFYKKRYSARNLQSPSVLFNPFLIPGLNAVFLDDSAAGQSFIAKLQGVTHYITHQGCNTSVNLGLGRDFDEIDYLTGDVGEPPLPPWFDTSIFGAANDSAYRQETAWLLQIGAIDQTEFNARQALFGTGVVTYENLSKFYQGIAGVNSTTVFVSQVVDPKKPITTPKVATVKGAVQYLISQYVSVSGDPIQRDKKVAEFIQRPIPTMVEAFAFLGAAPVAINAQTKAPTIPDEFAVFQGIKTGPLPQRFDGIGYSDQKVIAERRGIIDKYVALLKNSTGFRG